MRTITFSIGDALYDTAIEEYGSEENVISFILSEWQRITINNKIRDVQKEHEEALAAALAEITSQYALGGTP